MRFVASLLVVLATVAGAGEVELRLPPSDAWIESVDPQKPPSSTAVVRYFIRKDDPEVTLRVITDSSMQLDYSLAVVEQIGKLLVASQKKPAGTPLRVSEPKVISVEGVNVGSLQVVDPAHLSTLFYVPSAGGDRVLTIQCPAGKPVDLKEIYAVVESAKGLRKPDVLANGTTIMGAMAVLSLGVIGVLLWFMRKKE